MSARKSTSIFGVLLGGLLGAALVAAGGPTATAAAAAKPCPPGKVAQKKAGKRVCVPKPKPDSVKLTVTPASLQQGGFVRIAVAGYARLGVNLVVVRRPLISREGKRFSYKGCRAAAGGWAVLNSFREGPMSSGISVRKGRFAVLRRGAQISMFDLPSGATWQICAKLVGVGGRTVALSNPTRIAVE